jgi:hypothetical protein
MGPLQLFRPWTIGPPNALEVLHPSDSIPLAKPVELGGDRACHGHDRPETVGVSLS